MDALPDEVLRLVDAAAREVHNGVVLLRTPGCGRSPRAPHVHVKLLVGPAAASHVRASLAPWGYADGCCAGLADLPDDAALATALRPWAVCNVCRGRFFVACGVREPHGRLRTAARALAERVAPRKRKRGV